MSREIDHVDAEGANIGHLSLLRLTGRKYICRLALQPVSMPVSMCGYPHVCSMRHQLQVVRAAHPRISVAASADDALIGADPAGRAGIDTFNNSTTAIAIPRM